MAMDVEQPTGDQLKPEEEEMTIAKDFYGEATYAKCGRSSKRGEGKLLDELQR